MESKNIIFKALQDLSKEDATLICCVVVYLETKKQPSMKLLYLELA